MRAKAGFVILLLILSCPLAVVAQNAAVSGQLRIVLRIPATVKLVSSKLGQVGRWLCMTRIPARHFSVKIKHAGGQSHTHVVGYHSKRCLELSSRTSTSASIRSVTIVAE